MGSLRQLDTVVPPAPDRPAADPNHPMRSVTQQIAFEPDGWTPERAKRVAELFDGLAAGWADRMSETRVDAVADALARGGPYPGGRCLEVGSGVGLFTSRLADVFGDVIAADLSREMLRRSEAEAPRVQADACRLPFPDASFGVVVLINMFLFPREVNRLLAPRGTLLWVNTHGDATPIYLPADDVARALPSWDGVHAAAGWGIWAALRKPG